jgi:hypothetical protein
MARAAIFTLFERGLGYFVSTLFHLKNLDMAVRTFGLLLGDVGLMTKNYRTRTAFACKLDLAPAHFLLLRKAHANRNKA